MARYIDADLFKQCVQENITRYFTCGTGGYCLAEDVLEDIDAFPTADVVPKSEVEKLNNELMIWKQDRFNLYQRLELYEMARQKVAREIFAEIDRYVIRGISVNGDHLTLFNGKNYAELKKKYTEAKK